MIKALQAYPMTQQVPKRGFTLVELLVVISLLIILAGMLSTTYSGVSKAAREARTKAIITAVDAVIQEKYESYLYRPLPVEIPDVFRGNGVNASTEVGLEVLATEAARVRLFMIRDLQRMEMPDRWSDIVANPTVNGVSTGIAAYSGNATVLYAAASPVAVNVATGDIVGQRNDPSLRRGYQVTWYESNNLVNDNIPSQLAAYRSRFNSPSRFEVGNTVTAEQILANQGAECLYMIMATSFVGGLPALESIPPGNIGDTDNDGYPEILDGWGQPLLFVRWPVGYVDPTGLVDRTVPDDFDLFRSDYAYEEKDQPLPAGPIPAPAAQINLDGNSYKPWSMRPLIASIGSDGESGIATNPITASGLENATYSYKDNSNWGVNEDLYGSREVLGRAAALPWRLPDPFMRNFISANSSSGTFNGVLPGQQLRTNTARDERSDNITNYKLQAIQ